jgi:hypothetical protein
MPALVTPYRPGIPTSICRSSLWSCDGGAYIEGDEIRVASAASLHWYLHSFNPVLLTRPCPPEMMPCILHCSFDVASIIMDQQVLYAAHIVRSTRKCVGQKFGVSYPSLNTIFQHVVTVHPASTPSAGEPPPTAASVLGTLASEGFPHDPNTDSPRGLIPVGCVYGPSPHSLRVSCQI